MAKPVVPKVKPKPPIKHSSWVVATHGTGKDRHYLMGKRAKSANNSGQWGFFGGTNDPGEQPQESAQREFHEETGIKKHIYHHLGTHKTPDKHNHYYLAKFHEKAVPHGLDKKETETHKWVTEKQAKSMNLHSSAAHYFNIVRPKNVKARKMKKTIDGLVQASDIIDTEGKSNINGIAYDQEKGLGNVPDNQNVNYKGLSVMMKPSQFKKLAAPRDFDHDSSIKHVTNAIKTGKPIGSPFLDVNFDPKHKKPAMVMGHEGRTRMEAIQKVHGDVPVLVHIFAANGNRARHITPDHLKALHQAIVPEEKKAPISGPHFDSKIHHLGEWKDVEHMSHNVTASVLPDLDYIKHVNLEPHSSHTGGRVKEYHVKLNKTGRHLGVIYNEDSIDKPQTNWKALHKGKFTMHPSKEAAALHILNKSKPQKWELTAASRELEIEAGLGTWAKSFYHSGKALMHESSAKSSAKAADKHQEKANAAEANGNEPARHSHQILADHHSTMVGIHNHLMNKHGAKAELAMGKTMGPHPKPNWRDNISNRVQPPKLNNPGVKNPVTPDPVNVAKPTVGPKTVSPKEANQSPTSTNRLPTMPPHPKGSEGYHKDLLAQHTKFAKEANDPTEKEHHENMADLHKSMIQPSTKAEPVNPSKNAKTPEFTSHKEAADYHQGVADRSGIKGKKIYHQQMADEHMAKHNAENKPATKPAVIKDPIKKASKYSIKPNPSKPTEPEAEEAPNKQEHMRGLRAHQAAFRKHTKIADNLKVAMTTTTDKDVKKKQREALKEHNGHIKEASDNIKKHTKVLKGLGVSADKLAHRITTPKSVPTPAVTKPAKAKKAIPTTTNIPKENPFEEPPQRAKIKKDKTIKLNAPKKGALKKASSTPAPRRKRA